MRYVATATATGLQPHPRRHAWRRSNRARLILSYTTMYTILTIAWCSQSPEDTPPITTMSHHACPAGFGVAGHTLLAQDVVCTPCKPGHVSPVGARDCKRCPPGSYQNATGGVECTVVLPNCTRDSAGGATTQKMVETKCADEPTASGGVWFILIIIAACLLIMGLVVLCACCCAIGH